MCIRDRIYLASEDAPRLWRLLMEHGRDEGLIPCGLGARDTLRLEASMPLYGHEMDDAITPKEAGLGMFVKMDKEDFIGKKAIEARGPLTRRRVGLKVTGRGIVREHQPVYADGRQIGVTTSGTHCPYLGYPVAMALLDIAYKEQMCIRDSRHGGHEHPVPARSPVPLPRHGPQLGGKPRLQCGIVHIGA